MLEDVLYSKDDKPGFITLIDREVFDEQQAEAVKEETKKAVERIMQSNVNPVDVGDLCELMYRIGLNVGRSETDSYEDDKQQEYAEKMDDFDREIAAMINTLYPN